LAHGNITVVARRQATLTIKLPVGNCHWQHGPPCSQRWLDQGCMKMQQTSTIRRGSFGKDGYMLSLAKDLCHLLIDHLRVTAAAALQKYRVVLRRQPADQWPMPDFFFRHEGCRHCRIDHVDVDPGNVIGDEQGPGNGMRQVGLNLDTKSIEQGPRPTCLERQALAVAAQRKDAQGKESPADYQQGYAKNPESADRYVCLAQSSCPR
jgi:hypothetical protein